MRYSLCYGSVGPPCGPCTRVLAQNLFFLFISLFAQIFFRPFFGGKDETACANALAVAQNRKSSKAIFVLVFSDKTADIFRFMHCPACGGTQFPLKMQLLLLKTYYMLNVKSNVKR